MLNDADYINAFVSIQQECWDATLAVSQIATSGVSEQHLADVFHQFLAKRGITKEWYPTLVCAGKYSGQPLTRRNHLPDKEVILRDEDIVILDTTPLKSTVWGNWTVTKSIGSDPFYKNLCADIFAIVIEVAAETLQGKCRDLRDIYLSVLGKAKSHGLENIEPRGNVGHNIFQVPEEQTVDKTPLEDRVFIDETDKPIPQKCLISIEPELAREHKDGIRYGGKFQFIIPVGYGEAGIQLVNSQVAFYEAMVAQEHNLAMEETLATHKRTLMNVAFFRFKEIARLLS